MMEKYEQWVVIGIHSLASKIAFLPSALTNFNFEVKFCNLLHTTYMDNLQNQECEWIAYIFDYATFRKFASVHVIVKSNAL